MLSHPPSTLHILDKSFIIERMTSKLGNPDSIDEYAYLCSYASAFTQGWLRKKDDISNHSVTVLRSSRGIDEDRARTALEVYTCTNNEKITRLSSQSLDVVKPVVFDISPSGAQTVAFHNAWYNASGAKEDKPTIELTSDNAESYRIDVSNAHGPILGDTWFGGCTWSSDERFVAYVAQVKLEKPQTYFGSQSYASYAENGGSCAASSSKYNYVEDWGERFGGVGALGLFVLDVQSQTVRKISDIDTEQWTVGQPCLIAIGAGETVRYLLAYTAFSNLPRKLGVVYCFHRPHSVFVTDLTALLLPNADVSSRKPVPLEHHKLSVGLKTARSARCSPDGRQLVFLGQEAGFDMHNGCSELFVAQVSDVLSAIDGSSGVPAYRKVVAQVDQPSAVSSNGRTELVFPGLYCEALPSRCFMTTSSVVLSSQWASDIVLLTVDLNTCEVRQVRVDDGAGSAAVLDVQGSLALCCMSTPTLPARLCVYDLQAGRRVWAMAAPPSPQAVRLLRANAAGGVDNKSPAQLDCSLRLSPAGFQSLNWQTCTHTTDGILFESILIYPNSMHPASENRPTSGIPIVMVPHGGPHSCMATAFFHAYAFLAYQLGAVVAHVNYRGSPGFGQASVDSLPGNVGKNDVADVLTALFHAQSLRFDPSSGCAVSEGSDSALPPLVDASRVSVVGGSHGGFLAGHMVGQYPDIFKAAAMRNPVTDISAEYSVSDIPGEYLLHSICVPTIILSVYWH